MEKCTAMRYANIQTKPKQSKKQYKQDVNNNWERGAELHEGKKPLIHFYISVVK